VEANLRTVHWVIDEAVLAKKLRETDLEQSAYLVSMKEKFPDRPTRRAGWGC